LRRKLSRLSALFEIADDEFFSLKRESRFLANQISEQLSAGDQQIAVHQLSISKYVETSSTLHRLCDVAEAAGFRFESEHDEPDDDSETISDIIQLAGVVGVRTIAELEHVLASTLGFAGKYLPALYQADGEKKPGKWGATPAFVCVLMLIGAKAQHIREGLLVQLGWDDGIARRVMKVAKGWPASGA